MFVLHLLLLFDLVFCSWDYEVSSYPSYSSINYGLFNKFNRHEPFVLFRTKYGLQQLTGNGTCYTPKSIYQPSTNLIDYWEYSIDDNYIGWVNKEINQYCSKNLFNDHWNDAYVWDIKNECLQMGTPGKLQTASHFSLSVSRKVVYIIFKSGDIQVASVRNSTCMFFLSDTPYESPSALHITNFIFKQDRLLIGDQSRRIIYAMSPGANEFIGQLNLTDPDELMMIDSDQRGHIYIAVKRYNRSLVLQYDHSLSNHSILFETNEDEEIRSISATNYNLAVLVKSNASFTNESTNSNDTIFLLHLITLDTKTSNNVNQSNDTNTIFTCHVDHSDESILSVTLVDIQMKTMKKKICKENNALCLHSVGQCKPKSLFQLIPQIRFNTDKIHNELCAKLILSLILTIFTIFLFLIQQISYKRF